MTKLLILKDGTFAVVAPNGVKPFTDNLEAALYVAKGSAKDQMKYIGAYTESQYRRMYPVKRTMMVK